MLAEHLPKSPWEERRPLGAQESRLPCNSELVRAAILACGAWERRRLACCVVVSSLELGLKCVNLPLANQLVRAAILADVILLR